MTKEVKEVKEVKAKKPAKKKTTPKKETSLRGEVLLQLGVDNFHGFFKTFSFTTEKIKAYDQYTSTGQYYRTRNRDNFDSLDILPMGVTIFDLPIIGEKDKDGDIIHTILNTYLTKGILTTGIIVTHTITNNILQIVLMNTKDYAQRIVINDTVFLTCDYV